MAKDWMAAIGGRDEEEKAAIEAAISASMEEEAQDNPFDQPPEDAYDAKEVAEACRIDLNWLAGIATPAMFIYAFPPVLLAAWQLLSQSALKVRDFTQIALGIPRGHGKTTLIKLFILWCILFTDKKFILVVSSTSQLAENIVADVVDMLNERNIVRVFGDWKIGLEVSRTDLKKFSYRNRSITLACIGVGGSLRGLNIKNDRPDIMIFEDIQTKEASESDVQSQAIERWMIGTAMKAKSPHGCLFVFCGNMYPGPNSILKKLKALPGWIKFIAGAILSDGTALWEKLRPLRDLIIELDNDIEMGHPEIFFSEVLNDTEAGINNKIDLAQIKPWPYTKDDLPQGKFIVIDPSTGKLGGDLTAIGLFEVFDGRPALRNVEEDRLSPGNTIRRALLLALRNGVGLIAVESTSYQSTLLYWFGIIADQLGLAGIQFVEVHTGMNSKNTRITTALKAVTANEILIHPDVKSALISQIANWNPLRRDNVDGILDLLTYGPKVLELYGYAVSTQMDLANLEAAAATVEANNSSF